VQAWVRRVIDDRKLRRWIGVVIFFLVAIALVWVASRLGPRSPLAFVILPVIGILTMKLVERRVARWFRLWAEREAARDRRTKR
jgi:hypothetical protein